MKQSAWQTVMGILLLGIVALVSWQSRMIRRTLIRQGPWW